VNDDWIDRVSISTLVTVQIFSFLLSHKGWISWTEMETWIM